jgi:3-phenylpropionate/cinnamic acid dioxygenase small subunit
VVLEQEPVPFEDPLYHRVAGFYAREAYHLDARQYRKWLEMLTEDVCYEAPVRVSVYNEGHAAHTGGLINRDGFACATGHYEDDRLGLEMRITHIEQQSAWAEEPAGRTRRFVSSILATHAGFGELTTTNSLLVLRSVRSRSDYEFTSGERLDTLAFDESTIRLRKRFVRLDQTLLAQGVLPFL